ncbi:MAG: hypothetical protein LBM96_11180 [Methanobrevibacter sp.]|jgi:hypothetical protein|nr:hypothetical protein [Candidatus Methanoflexus mossambicus]
MSEQTITMEKIKENILKDINNTLKDYPHSIDGITAISFSKNKSYIGNVKFLEMNKVDEACKLLEPVLNIYGKVALRTQEVVSCCAPTYMMIGIKIDVKTNE